MREFVTTNGKKRVVINPATIRDVKYLKNALLTEIKNYPLGLKLLGNTSDVLDKQIDFSEMVDFIKNVIISADTSEAVENAINQCLKCCTYDSTRVINEDLFNDVKEAREDYYEIIFACIEENLRPFIQSLASGVKKYQAKLGENHKLNTILATLT